MSPTTERASVVPAENTVKFDPSTQISIASAKFNLPTLVVYNDNLQAAQFKGIFEMAIPNTSEKTLWVSSSVLADTNKFASDLEHELTEKDAVLTGSSITLAHNQGITAENRFNGWLNAKDTLQTYIPEGTVAKDLILPMVNFSCSL